MPGALHLQRFPCPQCHSLGTVQMDTTGITETLHCPDCGTVWDRVVPPGHSPATRRLISAITSTLLNEH
jgi:uncharacterized Zn finger protein